MTGAFGRHKRRRGPFINITSLIDVMFLLLIFFMVSSTFRDRLGIAISLPAAETATEQSSDTHEITVDAQGGFHFGEQRVDDDGLRASIIDLLERQPDAVLVLRADEQADFGRVIRAMDIARRVGGTRLIIPTRYDSPDRAAGR